MIWKFQNPPMEFLWPFVEEPLLNEMLEDLDLLKQRLAECDADQRNRPNSIGLREKQMEAIQSVLETNGNITIGSLPTGWGRRELLRALLGLYGESNKARCS